MLWIGVAFDPFLASADALGGAVTTLHGFRRGTKNLDQHRVIDIAAESAFNKRLFRWQAFSVLLIDLGRNRMINGG